MKKVTAATSYTEQVNEFMGKLDHSFKGEVQMIREIITKLNEDITQQIKWNVPSFRYKREYLVTFNLRARQHIHVVFHNPMISKVKSKLLERDYDHKRIAYFSDKNDITAKKTALEKALKDLIKLQKKMKG